MSHTSLKFQIPGGQVKTVRLDQVASEDSLANSLEKGGLPLNMRCGGRGLCRGCEIEISSSGVVDTIRACQNTLNTIPESIDWIRIPENSWRDHSLHGVSVFEIHTKTSLQRSRDTGYGIAMDIGTTTIAGALWDFSNHHCLAHNSKPNPQGRFGDNVVSRIHYAVENAKGPKDLQRVLVKDGLIPMVRELCQSAGIEQRSIVSATASGNPTMLHTLAGESLEGLAKYPFQPAFLEKKSVVSTDIGFHYEFELDLLPGLGPFVGSDIAVGALASGMLEEGDPILLIDFGTNGEILLSYENGFLATATAAGPAFEGGRLNCGATARDGVISSILREKDSWKWTLSGNCKDEPTGISGAAYVDFIATGAKTGLLDHFGRFDRTSSEVYQRNSGSDSDWTISVSERAFVTEADVAELLQAKAAIGGGVLTLMEKAGIEASELKRVLVAGGFGYHLNPQHAIDIGLLPDVPVERVQMIGNASLGGACLLLNDHAYGLLGSLLESCEVVELNQMVSFEDNFTDCLMLERMDS
jgi:uncharacterized 2Fe-2S/4Fe-4S cluster protein (DUF4445 family)